jgi:hypothetical protein
MMLQHGGLLAKGEKTLATDRVFTFEFIAAKAVAHDSERTPHTGNFHLIAAGRVVRSYADEA